MFETFFYRIWLDFIRMNVLGLSNNGNPTLESVRILFAMLSGSVIHFGYIIFKFILSKTDRPNKQQKRINCSSMFNNSAV